MYRVDVDSIVEDAFNRLEKHGLREILHSDWLGIITITAENKILINCTSDDKNIENSSIINLLTSIKTEILALETSVILSLKENGLDYNFILAPTWELDSDKMVFISCSIDEGYNKNDLKILNVITNGSYQYILLNNEIIKEKNYLQNIFDSTDLGLISINLQGEITKVNKRIYSMLGIQQDLIGKNFFDYISDNQMKVMKSNLDYIIFKNKELGFENIIYKDESNRNILLNVTISPLIDGLKYVYGVVIAVTDVTKTKIFEKEDEQVKRINLLGDVSAEIAHELRNPLMGIRGCARILQKGIDKNSKQYNFIESIVKEVDSANETVERFLAYSRMNKEDTYTLVDLNVVLDKCSNLISFYKEDKYIVVKKDLCEKLPRIKGNVVRLQQAFINIFINSVQAIEDEGFITIRTSYLENKKEVIVEISDDGMGIAPDKMDAIFDPYFTTKKDGSGLGLSITKKIIEKNGGEIYVSSEENSGAKFQIIFQYEEMM